MKNLFAYFPLIGFSVLAAGCGGQTPTPRATRACDSYSQEVAQGHNPTELQLSRAIVLNHRKGCQDAVQFMVVFSSALFEEGVVLDRGRATALGTTWCNSQYVSVGPIDREARRDGCTTGIRESIQYTRGIASIFSAPTSTPITSDHLDSIYQRSLSMVARLRGAREQTLTAQSNLQRQIQSESTLTAARAELANARAAADDAVSRAQKMRAHQVEIASTEQEARSRAASSAAELRVSRELNSPLQQTYDAAHTNEVAALAQRDQSRTALSERQSRISQLQNQAARETSQIAEMRGRIPAVREEAGRLRSEASSYRNR